MAGWVWWVASLYAGFLVGFVVGWVSRRVGGGGVGGLWGRLLWVAVYPVVGLAGLRVGVGLAGVGFDAGLLAAVVYYGVVPAVAGVVVARLLVGWLGLGGGRG